MGDNINDIHKIDDGIDAFLETHKLLVQQIALLTREHVFVEAAVPQPDNFINYLIHKLMFFYLVSQSDIHPVSYNPMLK